MAYSGKPDPIIVEHMTVQPVVEHEAIVTSNPWYSEPWGIGLVIALVAIFGIVIYFVGFNQNTNTPVVTNNTTRVIKESAPASKTVSTPIIVNSRPALSNPTINVTAPSAKPPVVIDNASNPPATSDYSGTKSNSPFPANRDQNSDSTSKPTPDPSDQNSTTGTSLTTSPRTSGQ